ncbi:GRDP1-like protein, partial [Mya arenaria]
HKMSETDQALDPIPVTKDIPVVNGNADIEPLDSDLTNGVSKPVMEMSNGVENNGLNGDHVEEDISEVPVNGDCENDPDINCADDGDVDLMGGDDLPPPPEEVPEIVPELPPPPPMADPQEEGIDSSVDQNLESSVDPVVDTNANPAFESSVDPEEVDDQCMDNNDELMNVSDNEDAIEDKESVDNILELPPRIVEDFSEEELVSDGGLEEESYVNVVNTQKQTGEEDLQSDCQLIEFGEAAPPVPPTVERTVPEQKEPEVEPAEPVESVSEPETIIPQISLPDEQEETAVEEDVQRNEISEQNEMSVEPKPEVPVQPEQVKEEEVPSQVEETVPVEDVPEPEPEQTQPQMGFSEPAIVVDNKPAEEEVEETPPPPPPPLVDETPAPPPPLDESIPLRRVSGGSSPSKDSSQSLESPTPMNQNVAVVLPQPETQKQEQEAAPIPKPLAPVNQEPQQVQQEIVPPPSQPVAVVAPQVHMEPEEDVSPPASPPGSPSTTSVGEIAEGEQISSPQVSQKINKKNFKNKIKFGTDLIEGSIKQLHFLKTVNNNPGLYEEWLFKKAIRRYEAFWLPLAAEHKKECLTAPWDIEWVWHCHMLAPVAYEADSRAQVGLLVDHKLLSEKDRTKALEKSRKYWHAKYPKEPFEIDLVYKEKVVEEQKADEKTAEATNANKPQQSPPQPRSPHQSQLSRRYLRKTMSRSHRMISLLRSHASTSLSHFHDKHFLKAAQKRYQRFLFLKHQNSTEVLVPCYDIDLMWHTHMLHPGVYKHDTTKVLGQMLVHDDSVNNRAPGSTLVRADQKTRDLWKQHFDDTFTTFGAMFRGEPPVLCERMSLIDPEETYTFSTKKATVNLDRVQVEDLPEEVNKYSVKLAFGANEREGPMIKQFKGNKKKVEFENTKKGLAHFVFDTKEYDRINFNMSQQIGFACAGHDEELGQQMFNLMPVIEGIPMDKNDSSNLTNTVTIDVDTEHSLKATFSATIEPPKQGPTMLFMMPGNFETRICIMPEQILQ